MTGYAFAYGGDDDTAGWTFIGNRNFFLMGDDINYSFWFFQFAFACAVSSIVAGTIAERTQMKAYLLYSVFLVGFVYPVAAHAFWSTKGFLGNCSYEPLFGSGAIDFAGCGPVHMLGTYYSKATPSKEHNSNTRVVTVHRLHSTHRASSSLVLLFPFVDTNNLILTLFLAIVHIPFHSVCVLYL